MADQPLDWLRRDDGRAQFVRFVAVGVTANVLYGALFLLLADLGSQAANVAGSIASSALANELHRRLTFRAGGRVPWLRAQSEGGGLALVGVVATTAALEWFQALAPAAGAAAHLVVVAVVTGAVGLGRFVVLRWLFGGRGAQAGPSSDDRATTVVGVAAGPDHARGRRRRPAARAAAAQSSVSVGIDQVSVTRRSCRTRTTREYGIASDRLSPGTTVAPAPRAAACARWPVIISAYGVRTRNVSDGPMPTHLRAYRSARSTQSSAV